MILQLSELFRLSICGVLRSDPSAFVLVCISGHKKDIPDPIAIFLAKLFPRWGCVRSLVTNLNGHPLMSNAFSNPTLMGLAFRTNTEKDITMLVVTSFCMMMQLCGPAAASLAFNVDAFYRREDESTVVG